MAVTQASYRRDANYVPITYNGLVIQTSKTLTGNNTTVAVPIFSITGTVQCIGIWGVVTTVLGANNTAAYWRLNDGSAQSNITVNTGTTLSTASVGSLIVKKDLASAALTLVSASQERVSEPTTLETAYLSSFVLMQKTGGVATNVEFVYSTTDTPTSGTINFSIGYVPLSPDGNIVAL